MYASTLSQHQKSTCELVNIGAEQRSSLASRLPQRSLRQVYTIPLSDFDPSPPLQWEIASNGDWQLSADRPQVSVAAIPSSVKNCRHNLFIEDGTRLKKLDLPSTTCVAVSQEFEARVGDRLRYDYVVLLCSRGRFDASRPAVRAVLVNYALGSAISLMDRSIDACGATSHRAGSRFRESQSYTVPTTGQYELRFITFVDCNQPGSEAHLLVDAVRVENPFGQEVIRLASLSCVGRARRELVD